MKRIDPFDGYTLNVFLDDDGEYLAHFVEIPNVSAFGESAEEALRELQIAWEGVKESYQKHGEAIPVAPARWMTFNFCQGSEVVLDRATRGKPGVVY